MVQRRYSEAIVFFDESLTLNRDQPRAWYYKALCLIAMKERKEAIPALKKIEDDQEFGGQAKYLLAKIYHDSDRRAEASSYFGMILKQKNPMNLKDILFYKGYEIIGKPIEELNEDDLTKIINLFNRGSHLKNTYSDVKKEFLYHLGGAYLLKEQFNEAKMVFRDLCRIDAYYKGADQILKMISKEMLIQEEQHKMREIYKKYKDQGHYQHQITAPLKTEEFFPTHLPLLVLEKLEELAQKKILNAIKQNESLAAKFDFHHPRNPLDFSASHYDIFVEICIKICEKVGVVVHKNIGESKNEAMFLGVDKDELKTLIYFYKPAAILGAIAMADVLDRKERFEAKRVSFFCCGDFTEEARNVAKDNGVNVYNKVSIAKFL